MRKSIFTLDEANQLVPWLEDKFHEIESDLESLRRLESRLVEFRSQSRLNGHSSLDDGIDKVREGISTVNSRMQRTLSEIQMYGVIVRDTKLGLVDFLSMDGDQEIFLCWKKGEARVEFWHQTDEGYMSRKPL